MKILSREDQINRKEWRFNVWFYPEIEVKKLISFFNIQGISVNRDSGFPQPRAYVFIPLPLDRLTISCIAVYLPTPEEKRNLINLMRELFEAPE